MAKVLLCLLAVVSFSGAARSVEETAVQTLKEEYQSLKEFVLTLEPDTVIGGYYEAKEYGDYLFMWKIEEGPKAHNVIRFFAHREGHSGDFAVTYHKTPWIVEGRTVLRRFFGPEPYGWRNDTIDYETNEYLGRQGMREPRLRKEDEAIMNDWDLTVFDF